MDISKVLEEIKANYPSLKSTRVKLVFKNLEGSGKVRWSPTKGYRIILNPKRLNKLDKKELKGLIAHELAHVYQIKNDPFGYLGRALGRIKVEIQEILPHKHVKKSFRKVEQGADKIAIDRGFGDEVFAIRKFVEKEYSNEKLNKMKEIYMSSQEIKEYIKQKNA